MTKDNKQKKRSASNATPKECVDIEELEDLATFEPAYSDYLKDPKTYTCDEVAKEFGIE